MVSGQGTPAPATRRILQIAYYENLLRTRATMLQHAGYAVASVLGNDEAKATAARLLPGFDLVVIGFSGAYSDRNAMLRWLKQQYPGVPVVVLQAHSSERFPDADCSTLSEDPEHWLRVVADCLDHHSGRAS